MKYLDFGQEYDSPMLLLMIILENLWDDTAVVSDNCWFKKFILIAAHLWWNFLQ